MKYSGEYLKEEVTRWKNIWGFHSSANEDSNLLG
jgi:hypothetical protein